MKIYQLHEFGGEWEDKYDYIIGSYLRKERAEEEMAKAVAYNAAMVDKAAKCRNCPLFDREDDDSVDDVLTAIGEYCTMKKIMKDEYGTHCENYSSFVDESYFRIEEIEVEE